MDSVLSEERDQIAPRVRTLMQAILDRYKVGVEVVGINVQRRAAARAGAGRVRRRAEGRPGPRARQERRPGLRQRRDAARHRYRPRLNEEAEGYKARIVAQAEGDAQRFSSVLTEYQKAPQVTRDRMYIDAMQQIYTTRPR